MENSKLIKRLRILSEQEMKDFILFADSPYFNSNAALTRLLKYLQKYHPELEGTKLSKALVYKKVFPEKGIFKEKRLNDLMTQLFKLSEDFLAFDRFKKSEVARAKQEFLSYREKGMDKDFSKAAIKLKKAIEAEPENEEYHFELFLLNKELFIEQGEDKVKSLNAVFHHLDQYFIQEKLLFAAFAKNREKLLREEFNISLLDLITSEQLEKEGLSAFFSNLRQVLITENIEEIKCLIDEFKLQIEKLSKRLSYCILILILNILVIKHREIENRVTTIIFDLYKFAVAEKLIPFNNKISESTFINICILAAKMAEKEWLKNFMANCQDKIIPQKNRENTVNIATASVLFEWTRNSRNLKEIAEIVVEMNTLSFTDLRYSHMLKVKLAQLHFGELLIKKDYESFDYLINFCKNFETQLYRDKKTVKLKITAFLNFSKSIKKLAIYIFENNPEKIIELKSKITSDSLFAKKWLLQKAGEAIL